MAPTEATSAASACISPSTMSFGSRSFTSFTAADTLSTRGWLALPLVEKERRATTGSTFRNVRQDSAADRAISASCSEVGSGTVAQSEKMRWPSTPHFRSGTTMTKHDEAVLMPGRVRMMVRAARRTFAVSLSAPETMASARPLSTIMAPQCWLSAMKVFSASAGETPLCRRSS